ncbi:IclR family transcriptional regulator [Streptomyces sp. MUM 203J]|uniref:IclR family transcriptional regulator n=1 Tax=Streptomyces sp. MUM 203J TaxID=2791990 RepID=UPI001F04CA33|nr:IclR family transcriptional regulator [Streptomyces sp. MUM 203J]MCH0542923.1 IclR family transcriptional regulator [Streptomyces sp. MUM 203J]
MGRLVPAVTRALDILELFLDEHGDGTRSAPEVTRALRLPRTTVHELMTTLAARSYLVPVPERPGRYRLGVRGYQLGSRYAEQSGLAAGARHVVREVADGCGETVHVAVLDDLDIVYLAKADPTPGPVCTVAAVGRRLPAHCTAVGKMLLASLSQDEFDTRVDGRELTALTPASVTGHDTLRAQLAAVRDTGVAIEHHEADPDVSCVAAPVRDGTGQVVAALSIAVPTSRWTAEHGKRLAESASRGADCLSAALGRRAPC